MYRPRSALITGGSRGIGLAISQAFAEQGITPILNYRNDSAQAKAALQLVQAVDPAACAIRADVTNEDEVARLVSECLDRGPLDILVNNVGEFLFKPWIEVTSTEWEDVLASNLRSTFLCCKAVIPHMRERRAGNVINVLSMHAQRVRPVPNTLAYAIAKTGVAMMTKTLAKTEGAYGIRVNAVGPGFVETAEHTPKNAKDRVPLGRLAAVQEIAAAVLFLVSENAAYVTGQILDVHGGALL